MLRIRPIPAFSDNYIWHLQSDDESWVVDPGDAVPVLRAMRGNPLTGALITHHHFDHTGGLGALRDESPLRIVHPHDDRVPVSMETVAPGEVTTALGMEWTVLDVSAHTVPHIAYFTDQTDGAPVLLSGDALFSSGAGRLFEGSYQQMLDAMDVFATLPDDTRVLCAHEYTQANLRFALAVEPDNQSLESRDADVQAMRAKGQPSLPSTIGVERQCNPFLRSREPGVIAAASQHAGRSLSAGVETLQVLREWKDSF